MWRTTAAGLIGVLALAGCAAAPETAVDPAAAAGASTSESAAPTASSGTTRRATSSPSAGTRAKPTPAKPTQAKPTQAKPTQAKPTQAKPKRDRLAKAAEEAAADQPTDVPSVPAHPVPGADMSWPQCPKGLGIPERRTLGKPMPLSSARYVVIGLTNGPGFTPNPCLADQVAWAKDRGLMVAAYAVASYPEDQAIAEHGSNGPFDGSSRLGALRNTGFQQAKFNIASMRNAGLDTPIVWIDVEPVTNWEWTSDVVANAAVVEGAARGYRDAGYRIGAYSTPLMWQAAVGELRLGIPEWRPAGDTSRAEALRRCRDDWSFQGGRAVLGQWVEGDRDLNVTCPGRSMEGLFHQY